MKPTAMLVLAALAALIEAGDTTFCTDDNDLQPEIMPTGTRFGEGDLLADQQCRTPRIQQRVVE